MSEDAPKRSLLICGSPRMSGVSARYADLLADDLEAKGASVSRWDLARKNVAGCIGC